MIAAAAVGKCFLMAVLEYRHRDYIHRGSNLFTIPPINDCNFSGYRGGGGYGGGGGGGEFSAPINHRLLAILFRVFHESRS